jgi:hypothetical protein
VKGKEYEYKPDTEARTIEDEKRMVETCCAAERLAIQDLVDISWSCSDWLLAVDPCPRLMVAIPVYPSDKAD